MAEIVLVAIPHHEVGERQVFNTGVSTVGRAGNDYFCGHCGNVMMRDFDVDRLEIEIIYQCGACGGHNVKPEPGVPN